MFRSRFFSLEDDEPSQSCGLSSGVWRWETIAS